MPCLIPEILYDIGKKLIEDGDCKNGSGKIMDKEDVIIRFGLSGKEVLKAIKNVFITVTTLKITYHKVVIGWGKQYHVFDFNKVPKCLLYSIGESVRQLFIHRSVNPFLLPIIDKIIAKKQLISLASCAKSNEFIYGIKFIHEFIPLFSTTLNNLTIPSELLFQEFCDQIRLESLSLNTYYPNFIRMNFISSPSVQQRSREFSSSVKKLIFNDLVIRLRDFANIFKNVTELFSSLKILQFNMKILPCHKISPVFGDIDSLITIIKESTNFPTTVKYTVLNFVYFEHFTTTSILKDFVRDDDVDPVFSYFRQTIESANSQKIILEVLLPKNRETLLDYSFFDC